MPTYDNVRLMNMILNLYYIERLKQSEIADRLHLSTAKVNRLIQQARNLGYIEFIIRAPFQHLFELENRIKAVFNIQEAIVIPSVGDSLTSSLSAVGNAGAHFLLEHIRDGDVVAITPGTTVQAVMQSLDATREYDVEIVPILGSIQGELQSDMNYLAVNMGDRLGAKSYQLHAPVFVENRESCEALKSMEPVKKILDIGRNADVALLGVGTVDPKASRLVQYTALSIEEMNSIADDCGGVGEISAHVYNIDGHPCSEDYSGRIIGLTLDEIRNIPYRIGIASSAAKSLPIYGALRGGYLHALITDEAAARGVLNLFDEKFRGIE
ncbi:MAG: sugar-binding transcriptional regulator [Anaerolineales bacterium]|nr:sugar-binding transcriptional regulator [Anaerolineales bacterium]